MDVPMKRDERISESHWARLMELIFSYSEHGPNGIGATFLGGFGWGKVNRDNAGGAEGFVVTLVSQGRVLVVLKNSPVIMDVPLRDTVVTWSVS